jgi:hypothetical protein
MLVIQTKLRTIIVEISGQARKRELIRNSIVRKVRKAVSHINNAQ